MATFCLTHDGSEIVITPSWPGGEARVIDVNSGETVSTLHFELCNVGQAVFSANNEFLATYHECEDWEWPMRILLWRGRDFEAVRTALDPDEPGAIKPTDGFEALLQPTAKVDEPKTASKGKRSHGDVSPEPIHGESYHPPTASAAASATARAAPVVGRLVGRPEGPPLSDESLRQAILCGDRSRRITSSAPFPQWFHPYT